MKKPQTDPGGGSDVYNNNNNRKMHAVFLMRAIVHNVHKGHSLHH